MSGAGCGDWNAAALGKEHRAAAAVAAAARDNDRLMVDEEKNDEMTQRAKVFMLSISRGGNTNAHTGSA